MNYHQLLNHLVEKNKLILDGLREYNPQDEDSIIDINEWSNKLNLNQENIYKRLAWDGHEIQHISWAIEDLVDDSDQQWLSMLKEIIISIKNYHSLTPDRRISKNISKSNTKSIFPFHDIWLPVVSMAARKLSESTKDNAEIHLSDKALYDLEQSLLQRLCKLSSFVLFKEFNKGRTFGESIFAVLQVDPDSRQYYEYFVDYLCRDGLAKLFYDFPVLARLISSQVLSWIRSSRNLIDRLGNDISDIKDLLCMPGSSYINITGIETDCSDLHNGGQTVSILSIGKNKIVYKPRSVELEYAYNSFLKWYNNYGESCKFKTYKILSKDDYGWAEYVEYRSCQKSSHLPYFYRNAGSLLAILYVLGAHDCHCENLIASGDQLVLIDSETLMHPVQRDENSSYIGESERALNQKILESVLRTGLLPKWLTAQKINFVYDLSGLGINSSADNRGEQGWVNVNTDAMHWGSVNNNSRSNHHMPVQNLNVGFLMSYMDDVVQGFSEAYKVLEHHRDELISDEGPLSGFKAKKSRFIFRPTRTYVTIIEQLLQSNALKNGVEFSYILESLSKAYITTDKKPYYWDLLALEQKAIAIMDIPYFNALTDSRKLAIPADGTPSDFFEVDGFSATLNRIRELSEQDRLLQLKLIYNTFITYSSKNVISFGQWDESAFRETCLTLSQTQALEVANNIAADIIDESLLGDDGSCNWLGYRNVSQSHHVNIGLIDQGFYDGKCGLAFFFAALDSVKKTKEYASLIENLIFPIYYRLIKLKESNNLQSISSIGLGIGHGIGGILYTLSWLHRWDVRFGFSSPVEIAKLIVDEIPSVCSSLTQDTDIIDGYSGCILALLSLYRHTSSDHFLTSASTLGENLMMIRDYDYEIFKKGCKLPLTGFSHGSAGILYSLLQLYLYTTNDQFLSAAIRELDYEKSCFDSRKRNWPDYRISNVRGAFMKSWCHGAPGIGNSRLGCLGIVPSLDEALMEDVQAALATTYNASEKYDFVTDNLCCGGFGIAEILLNAGNILSDNTYLSRAHQILAHKRTPILDYKKSRLASNGFYNVSFFQGLSGIAYTYLRFAFQDKLPSVLLFA